MYSYYRVEVINKPDLGIGKDSIIDEFEICDIWLRRCNIESYILPFSYKRKIYKVENCGKCMMTRAVAHILNIENIIKPDRNSSDYVYDQFNDQFNVDKALIVSAIFTVFFKDYFKVMNLNFDIQYIKELEKKNWFLVYHPLVEGEIQ